MFFTKKCGIIWLTVHMKNSLFTDHDDSIIENFEYIFDSAANETIAEKKSIEYYLELLEEGQDVDIDEVINVAESYGFEFSNFQKVVKNYE